MQKEKNFKVREKKHMGILRNVFIIVVFILVVSLFVLRYMSESRNRRSVELSREGHASVTLSPNAGIPELMDALALDRVEEPWEAPDFELVSLDGDEVRLGQYRGKFVLLGFLTTW
jgi:hypothetical protein